MTQPRFPLGIPRTLRFWRQALCGVLLLDLSEHGAQLLFEPGMQHRVGDRTTPLARNFAGDRAKERQQFGGPSPLVFMRLQSGVAFGLPGGPRLRDGLIGSSFILSELHDPCRFCLLVGLLNQSFFSGVSGS